MAPREKKSKRKRPAKRLDSDTAFLRHLNQIKVTKEELWALMKKYNALRRKEGSVNHVLLVVQLFHKNPDKAKAINFRMEALAWLLLKEKGFPGWAVSTGEDGECYANHPAIFAAAAVEPLIQVSWNEFGFEKESFLRRVLLEAESEATA